MTQGSFSLQTCNVEHHLGPCKKTHAKAPMCFLGEKREVKTVATRKLFLIFSGSKVLLVVSCSIASISAQLKPKTADALMLRQPP